MEQEKQIPTEIVCWPDSMEFGGITWSRNKHRDDGAIEYVGIQTGIGRVRVYQYPDGAWGGWNDLDQIITFEYEPVALHRIAGTIVDTREDAMSFCLSARDVVQKDIQKMLLALGVGDPYSVGFRDGTALIKDKISDALKLDVDSELAAMGAHS